MPRNYQQRKERVRQQASAWQDTFSMQNYSYGEIAEFQLYFERLARRYGLLTEFRENAII